MHTADVLTTVLTAVIALLAGAAAGWYAARARGAEQTAALAAERDAARDQLATAHAERDSLRERLRQAEIRETEAAARVQSLREAQDHLRATFTELSQEALDKSNQRFLELADTRLKQAGAPLAETLGKVETQLREIERMREGAYRALTQQIDGVRQSSAELKAETAALVTALRKPQARGRWGELQLRNCVELAGMTERCDFIEQQTVGTDTGTQRPDMVIHLAGGKRIVVDAKVTLAAYLEAYEATDEAVREQRLTAHARHLREHVDRLAAKEYWKALSPTPEFVILFVPGDAFLAPALEHEPALLEEAFAKRVHIATPTTLISTLRTCSYAWQQEALAENARQVFDLGRELYQRLGTLGDHIGKIGRSLSGAVTHYNAAVGSLESRVLSTARKFNELKFVEGELASPHSINESVRPLAAPELTKAAKAPRAVVPLPPRNDHRDDAGDAPRDDRGRVDERYGIDAAGAG